ncbi:unnamed protein product [Fraxinus pennsylvanica]|uniref:Uncharacterized protein n=1 Tax=Fraxinus pennsylvanica TaxID=56036 RepID=A0AAD2DYL2_9LAMI|nr:unnamed protein product [Fraxinus pennsylvanica]
MGDPRHTEIEKNTVEESLLQSMEEGPQVQEEEEIPIECQFVSSDNDVDNDDFHYEKNASNHIEIGLHADPASEIEVGGEEEKSSDELDCPMPRRLLSNTTSEVQPSTPNSNFQFMPTPGIGVTSASQLKNYGPPPDQPGSLTMEKAPPQMQTTCIPLESMVKDFQNIENQETERKRAAMIKNKKVVQGSVTFVPPRLNKNSATQ